MKAKPQAILLLAIPILIVLAPLCSYLFSSLKAEQIEKNAGEEGTYTTNLVTLEDLSDKFEKNKTLTWGKDPKGGQALMSIRKIYLKALQSDQKAIQKRITEADKHFEGYISGDRNEAYTTGTGNFAALYNDAVKGDGLNSLQNVITYTQGDIEHKLYTEIRTQDSFIEIYKPQDLNDPANIKAAQKKLWIQQRLLYTFLKPSQHDVTRTLVMSLENKGGGEAITIDIPTEKASSSRTKRVPKKEYTKIYVYFTVIVDSRDLQQLIDEILSYTPHQRGNNATIPIGIRDNNGKFKEFAQDLAAAANYNPILNLEFRIPHYEISTIPDAPITRIKEMETSRPIKSNLSPEERDKELKSTTDKLNRPVRVSFRVEIIDYVTE